MEGRKSVPESSQRRELLNRNQDALGLDSRKQNGQIESEVKSSTAHTKMFFPLGTPETRILQALYEDVNAYRNKLVSSLDLVSREWSRLMPVDDMSLKHAHKCALKTVKMHQVSPANVDNFLLHLMGDPIRTTGVFNEFRLENIVRSHLYNQDMCNKIYDESFANMFGKLRDTKYGIEYWTAQHAKMHNTLATSLKGPTSKMYLNEFHRRAKRDTTIMQIFRGVYDQLDEIKSLLNNEDTKRSANESQATPLAKESDQPGPDINNTSSATQTAINKFGELLQQMEEAIQNRTGQVEQTNNEVSSLVLEDMQVNSLMEYVTQLKQTKTKYVQTIDDLQSKTTAIRRGIDCPKSKIAGESKWSELTDRIKGLEMEEQKVMKLLQTNISLATKLMSVINCYKDFYTLCRMFEREIEKKNEEYNSLRDVLNDKDNCNDKALLANVKSKKAEILKFVEHNLAKTNKESYLNRMSFLLKRFEGCMQSRHEMDIEQNVDQWYHSKKEEMELKEAELRQELGHLDTCLTTFDMLIGEIEKALSAQEHFKKDYIFVCLEGSQMYQLKYLCVSYESQKYQIFNDIGEEELNKKPLFEGKCSSRFLSKMEAKINTQTEKGTGFIFDGHRFFCNDFFEYRCWKSYVLTGHDLRQEQLAWNDQQEKREKGTPTQNDEDMDGAETPRTKLRQRRASMSVMT